MLLDAGYNDGSGGIPFDPLIDDGDGPPPLRQTRELPPSVRGASVRRLGSIAAALGEPAVSAVAAAAAALHAGPSLDELEAHFAEHSWVEVPNALSPAELEDLRAAIDADRKQFYYQWPLANLYAKYEQGPCYQHTNMLLTSPGALDRTITHPAIFPLVRRLVGEDIVFEELHVTIREPLTAEAAEQIGLDDPERAVMQQDWHRDDTHLLEHPLLLKTLSLIFYLDDVSADGHTFSIVPEGIETKRGLPGVGTEEGEASWRGTELNPALEGTSHVPAGIDIAAKAGSAILFHTGSLHAGTVRQTDELRRTIHIYYGHEGLPAL